MIAGAFAPLVSVPMFGNISLTQRTDGYIIIGLAVVSAIIVLLNQTKWLWGTAVISLGIMVYDFINIKNKVGGISGRGGEFGIAIAKSISSAGSSPARIACADSIRQPTRLGSRVNCARASAWD